MFLRIAISQFAYGAKLFFKVFDVLGYLWLIAPKAAGSIIADSNIFFSNPSNYFKNCIHCVSPPFKAKRIKTASTVKVYEDE